MTLAVAPKEVAGHGLLKGKVVIVTAAAGTGIGSATARRPLAEGADVVVSDHHERRLGETRDELSALGLGRVESVVCDVTSTAQVDALIASSTARLGRIDVLVNNAGISPTYGRLSDVSEELWDKVFAVNLKGAFRLSALVGERMAAEKRDGEVGGGSIINVSSTGAVRPTADIVPYAAAKAGVNAMTVGLADALGPKVRVNAIMPGPFLTSISRDWDLDKLAQRTEAFPLRRAGESDEIVGAALYFASDASSFTTGTVLAVDGGAQWAMPARM
jgi:NAD(P)-dependent dehydrogenase (short-subunit alcohol dehydrogenase family)